jgi:virulence factor
MIRIAVLGAGNHSSGNHGPALRTFVEQNPGVVELAAVCDLDEQKARTYAAKFGFAATYTDWAKMLEAEELHGIVAVTPIVLTEQIAGALLPQGIPLEIEKPPGEDSHSTRRLIAVAEQSGTPHMVSLNRRFSPALTKARQWLADRAADRPPRVAIARMLRHNRREDSFVSGTAIHLIDAVISLLGTPTHVSATNLPTRTPEAFLTQACVAFADGAQAHFIVSPVVGTLAETYEIHGEDYAIEIDDGNCTVKIWDSGSEVLSWAAPAEAPHEFTNGTLAETEAFISAVQAGEGFGPDLREALVSVETAEAVAAGGETDLAP